MPVHIQEITSNVTVADGQVPSSGPTPPVVDAIVPATDELPPLDSLVSEATHGFPVDQTFTSQAATSDAQQTEGTGATVTVDPAALYERVMRLMMDELTIARERE